MKGKLTRKEIVYHNSHQEGQKNDYESKSFGSQVGSPTVEELDKFFPF